MAREKDDSMDALLKKMNYKLGPIVVLGAPKEFGPMLEGRSRGSAKASRGGERKKSGFHSCFHRLGGRGDVENPFPRRRYRTKYRFLGRFSQEDIAQVFFGYQSRCFVEAHGAPGVFA
jgi:hypothetical protein